MIRLIHYPSRFFYDLIVAILFVSFHFLTSLTFSSFFYSFNGSPLIAF